MTFKNIISLILLLILISNFSYRVYTYRANYLVKYDHAFWTKKYQKSQWVVSGSKEGLGDDGLYAYAGYEYIKGKNPILINAEMPPLGKYLLGSSILIFQNQAIFAILTGILSLLMLFLLSLKLLKSRLSSLFVITAFSLEPLFYAQLSAPYLDLLYLTLVLIFLLSLFDKKFLLTAISLGLLAGTKSTLTSFALGLPISLIYIFINDKKMLKKLILILPLSFLVLILIYLKYFLLGNSLWSFFGVQKYVYLFYSQGAKGVFGSYLTMLFTGNWPTWWGTFEKITEWSILWPFLSFFSFISFIFLLFKKRLNNLLIIFLWLFIYSGFLLFIPVWPRYLLLILPFLYLVSVKIITDLLIFKKV